MLKTKQNHTKTFNLVKLILFVGVISLVYYQMTRFNENAWKEFNLIQRVPFILAILLVYPNIWVAYLQWKVTLNVVVPETNQHIRRQSFFAGIVTGMLTPNMVGNFIGRLYYFNRIHRSPIILFTLLSNYSQFLASMTFGWIAIFIVGDLYVLKDSSIVMIWMGVCVISVFLIYFFVENILIRIRKKDYFIRFKKMLAENKSYRSKILGLSLVRFIIFTTQFSLVLFAFGQTIDLTAIMAIWQVYLLTMLIPSLFLGKIGIKESAALFVLTGIGMNQFAVLFASLIIWFINSLSPALLGLIVCKNDKYNG